MGSFFGENFQKPGRSVLTSPLGKGLPPAARALWGSLLWENIKSDCFDFRVYLPVCVCVYVYAHVRIFGLSNVAFCR